MRYFLGIDGGGSKTHSVLADENSQVLSEGLSGASSLTATSVGAAGFALRESIRQAVIHLPEGAEIHHAVMGLAGMDTMKEHEIAHRVFQNIIAHFPIKKFTLVNDIEIALASGTDSPNAIALIAGTGSNCFGHNKRGETVKVGGLDFLLTDQGSGYAIGRRVLREAVKSSDGRSPKSILEDLVKDHFGIAYIEDLKEKVYNPLISKTSIAALSRICVMAHERGDAVATQIIHDAIKQLYIMVEAAIRRLRLKDAELDLVLAGSVARLPIVQLQLTELLRKEFPQIHIIIPVEQPVMGAVKLARS